MAVRCAILDDYQNVVLKVADWSKVKGDVDFKVFNEHLGGPDKVKIALVVHGPALKAFRGNTPNQGVKSDVGEVRAAGVELQACGHTMEAQKLTLGDLLPGFAVAEKGGVVKLAELQAQGFAYLRP